MNSYLLIAGGLTIFLSFAHSILGEILIFQGLRKNYVEFKSVEVKLSSQKIRVIWSTWNLLSIFGCAIGAILILLSFEVELYNNQLTSYIERVIKTTFLLSTFFWLGGTKGRHPAWVILGIISSLLFLSHFFSKTL